MRYLHALASLERYDKCVRVCGAVRVSVCVFACVHACTSVCVARAVKCRLRYVSQTCMHLRCASWMRASRVRILNAPWMRISDARILAAHLTIAGLVWPRGGAAGGVARQRGPSAV